MKVLTLYWTFYYLWVLGLKLSHVSKWAPGKYNSRAHRGRCPCSGRSCGDHSDLESITRRSGASCGASGIGQGKRMMVVGEGTSGVIPCQIHFRKRKKMFVFSPISRHRNGTSCSLWKTGNYLYNTVHVVTAGDLMMQTTATSASIVMT